MRVGIIVLLEESNTFNPERVELAHFRDDVLAEGDEVRQRFAGAHHEVAGFFAGLAAAKIEAVPIFAARPVLYGVIKNDTWKQLMRLMFDALERVGPLDGVLVAPHGAMVSESEPDADGYWLSELRGRLGPAVPIIGTLDPHANLSPRMVQSCNILIAYRTNPHTDQYQIGLKAADLMARTLRGEIRPMQAAAFPPVVINIERQETASSPCRELISLANRQLRQSAVLSNSVVLGFAYADVLEMGSAMLVATDNDSILAQQLANELAGYLWQHREEFVGRTISVKEAIQRALQLTGSVCLLDTGDNIGGGSPGDGTWIARALHDQRVAGSLACLSDPAAVAQCEAAGIGRSLWLQVGGHCGPSQGQPLEAEFTIVDLRCGRFEEREVHHGGFSTFDQGRTAVLRTTTGLTLIVSSRPVPPFSLAQITSCGLDPTQFRILVAKGVVAPIAAYQTVCRHFIRVTTPGITTTDLSQLNYRHRRRPLFPFEVDFEWAPAGLKQVTTA